MCNVVHRHGRDTVDLCEHDFYVCDVCVADERPTVQNKNTIVYFLIDNL